MLQDHPLSELFALHDGQPIADLAADIKRHGQLKEIILFNGQILDGRRRYRACVQAGVEPRTTTFSGTEDEARRLVMSLNYYRRHSTPGELAIAAATVANATRGAHPANGEKTISQAAADYGISTEAAKKGKTVLLQAAPEVVEAVKRGEVTLNDAYRSRVWTHEEQLAALAKLKNGESQSLFQAAAKGDAYEGPIAEVYDVDGKVVPDQARPAFAMARDFQSCYITMQRANDDLRRLRESVAGRLLSATLCNTVNQVRASIRAAMPTHVCPYCDGDKPECDCCQGEGWVGNDIFRIWKESQP